MQKEIQDLYRKLTDANLLTIQVMKEKDELKEKVTALTEENEALKKKLMEFKVEVKMMIKDEVKVQIENLLEEQNNP